MKKKNIPKWIPPEKRMRKYRKNMKDAWKVPFIKFCIVVPTEDDKEQLQAGFEFIHDNNSVMDNNFIVVNQIAHAYLDVKREKDCISPIVVDEHLFHKLEQEKCSHPKTYVDNGIEYCKVCSKSLRVTSYRD